MAGWLTDTGLGRDGLGDHVILCPDGTLDVQVMYVNLGGKDNSQAPSVSTGVRMAVLVNP